MRALTDRARVQALMRSLRRAARAPGRVYLTGGASAVVLGWRTSTVAVDLLFDGESERLLRELPQLKEELQINIELAAPHHFIPELPGWRERSLFIVREGPLDFYHYDFYGQALAKIERGHALDRGDVAAMLDRGLVVRERLRELFMAIEPELHRYPAIDPPTFRRGVEEVVGG